jgi:hypothetical protein
VTAAKEGARLIVQFIDYGQPASHIHISALKEAILGFCQPVKINSQTVYLPRELAFALLRLTGQEQAMQTLVEIFQPEIIDGEKRYKWKAGLQYINFEYPPPNRTSQ